MILAHADHSQALDRHRVHIMNPPNLGMDSNGTVDDMSSLSEVVEPCWRRNR